MLFLCFLDLYGTTAFGEHVIALSWLSTELLLILGTNKLAVFQFTVPLWNGVFKIFQLNNYINCNRTSEG